MTYLKPTPPAPALKPGEYVVLRGADTPEERQDAERLMRQNGCKRIRFEPLVDGRLQVHGYLAAG